MLLLVSWCFEPSQPQRITSGLNTNYTPSPSHLFHKISYHKSCFLSLFIFRGYSTREPASSRVTCFILQAYTETGVSHSQHRKKSGEVLEKMQVNGRVKISKEEIPGSKCSIYGYILTYSRLPTAGSSVQYNTHGTFSGKVAPLSFIMGQWHTSSGTSSSSSS